MTTRAVDLGGVRTGVSGALPDLLLPALDARDLWSALRRRRRRGHPAMSCRWLTLTQGVRTDGSNDARETRSDEDGATRSAVSHQEAERGVENPSANSRRMTVRPRVMLPVCDVVRSVLACSRAALRDGGVPCLCPQAGVG